MKNWTALISLFLFLLLGACSVTSSHTRDAAPLHDTTKSDIQKLAAAPIPRTNEGWRKRLTPAQFHILREQGTERPFSSPLDFETRKGTYYGADCGQPLFRSEQKYDSGTGWPSFFAPISPDALALRTDATLGIERTEVLSAKCGGHLGHVFDDGPPPTGKRYCMNGLALLFVPDPGQ